MNSNPNRLVRIAYASRAAFKPFDTDQGIDGNVANILATARRENKKNNLVGALYYGNGCFFQCLEGQQNAIDALYAKLLRDPRHTDLKILLTKPIDQVGFRDWEMKFATIDREIRTFLRNHNMIKFDPYRFDPLMSEKLVNMLHDAEEEASDEKVKNIVDEIIDVEEKRSTKKTKMILLNMIFLIIATAFIYFFMK